MTPQVENHCPNATLYNAAQKLETHVFQAVFDLHMLLLHLLTYLLCVCVCMCMCHTADGEVKGQLVGTDPLLPPYGSWVLMVSTFIH